MTSVKFLVILLIIFFIAVLIQRNYSKDIRRESKNPSNTISPSVSPVPTSIPTLAPTARPTILPTSASGSTNINNFIYPNSQRISPGGNSIVLQSSDDPQAVTNWYKEKITGLGMNAKSFVQTNTNGNILNKLAGANKSINVSIEISKQNSESETVIKILIK